MTIESLDIDRIVREVVRRLAESRVGEVAEAASPAPSTSRHDSAAGASVTAVKPQVKGATPHAGGESQEAWRLTTRLVTLESLAARPASARILSVARGTVVTPAARDQLRQWRIELKFVEAVGGEVAKRSAAPVGKLYLHGATGVKISASLVKSLGSLGWAIEPLVPAPLPQAIAELAAVLGEPTRIGVLLTPDRDLSLCLANRWSTVRALAVDDKAIGVKASIETAVRQWGANLLVLDHRRASEPTLRGWIEGFAKLGPRDCPPELKKYLARS
ncbi:MAG: hypothetical protein U1A77_08520 [Pirellulales bacterium]